MEKNNIYREEKIEEKRCDRPKNQGGEECNPGKWQ